MAAVSSAKSVSGSDINAELEAERKARVVAQLSGTGWSRAQRPNRGRYAANEGNSLGRESKSRVCHEGKTARCRDTKIAAQTDPAEEGQDAEVDKRKR